MIQIETLLTIAGFDPSSGAGITADLAVFAAHGLFGTSAISALTVQSTVGVRSVYAVETSVLAETLDCLTSDLLPAGIKIGMLATEENVRVVAQFLRGMRDGGSRVPVVLDPVLRSSSGRGLLTPGGIDALCRLLLPLVDWVTPNLAELAVLADIPVNDVAGVEAGCAALRESYPELSIVATGGHLPKPDDLVWTADGEKHWLRGEMIQSRATHGTGCAFSSALLCGLVQGLDGVSAAAQAKRFVTQAIRLAEPRGQGKGPMELLWPLRPGAS